MAHRVQLSGRGRALLVAHHLFPRRAVPALGDVVRAQPQLVQQAQVLVERAPVNRDPVGLEPALLLTEQRRIVDLPDGEAAVAAHLRQTP